MGSQTRAVRLSAIIPNYNHGAVIGEAIAAIAAQVPAADEIIVVDDASSDDSLAILKRLASVYPCLRIVNSETNQGAIGALNRGLGYARGEYVYFGAADDLTIPGLFKTMLEALQRHPRAAFASGEALVVDTDTGETGYRPPVRPSYREVFFEPVEVSDLLRRMDNWILSGAALIRRDLLLAADGFDPAMGSFADGFALRRLALRHGCCFVPFLGLSWQVSTGGYSRTQAADPAASMGVLDNAVARMRADPAFPPWYPALFARRWRFSIGRIAANAKPMNRALLTYLGRGPVGRAVLSGAATLGGPFGRLAALGWLAATERPTSPIGLIRTALARRRGARALRLPKIALQ
jgi:glycosyltransferase involved in cell wall biosynthesis